MPNNPLLLTAIVLSIGALLSGFLKGRERDRVLKDFSGYHVTLETLKGHLVWGDMHLHGTGLELVYRSDVQDEHHIETTYILYKEEFSEIQAIYRYLDELAGPQWEKRQQELRRTFHPGIGRQLRRHSRNFLNTISDSLSQAVGILVGYAQVSTKKISAGSDQYLSKVSQSIIGYVGTKYDPLLERYVGTKVVVEVTEGGVTYEHIGILKDYTADYLEILDVQYPREAQVQVGQQEQVREERNMRTVRRADCLTVTNTGENSLLIQQLRIGDQVKTVNAVLDKGDELELHLPADAAEGSIAIEAKVVRQLDWILPRAHALIRHKAERYDPDYVFDIGLLLRRDHLTTDEEEYAKALKMDPEDASSALALGQLLFQRGKLQEAERWFMQALKNGEKLPDGGKLAARQLHYIQDKQGSSRQRLDP